MGELASMIDPEWDAEPPRYGRSIRRYYFRPMPPRSASWEERKRIVELQLFLHCVKVCVRCHRSMDVDMFENHETRFGGVCELCALERASG
jgi:hypothetical protein